MPGTVGEIGRFYQALAGNAADPQADAADASRAVTVDQGHLASELGGTQRGDIAAGAGTDDDKVGGIGDLANDHQR